MCEAAWLGGVGPGEGSLGLTSGVPVTALAQDRVSLLVCWPPVWNRSSEEAHVDTQPQVHCLPWRF